MPPRRPVHLILDWDGTLTKRDTLHLVANIGYKRNNSARLATSNCLPPWSLFGKAWLDDYTAHRKAFSPVADCRTTIQQEREWLRSLEGVERASAKRVKASGLWEGVIAREIDDAARAVVVAAAIASDPGTGAVPGPGGSGGRGRQDGLQLRLGWERLFGAVLGPGREQRDTKCSDERHSSETTKNAVSVLSVNWSRRFIRSSLVSAVVSNDKLASYISDHMHITANEIDGIDDLDKEESVERGKEIRTSADKLSCLPLRCQENISKTETVRQGPQEGEAYIIYVGDSTTDLECLLAADLGICIRDDPMTSTQKDLADTLERLSLQTYRLSDRDDTKAAGSLYWIKDFEEMLPVITAI